MQMLFITTKANAQALPREFCQEGRYYVEISDALSLGQYSNRKRIGETNILLLRHAFCFLSKVRSYHSFIFLACYQGWCIRTPAGRNVPRHSTTVPRVTISWPARRTGTQPCGLARDRSTCPYQVLFRCRYCIFDC